MDINWTFWDTNYFAEKIMVQCFLSCPDINGLLSSYQLLYIYLIYIYMHIYIDAFLYKFDMISYGITNSRDLWPVRPYGKWRAWHPWHPWPCCRATWAPSGVPGAMVKNGWFITGVYMDHIYIYTYTYNYVYKTRMGRLLDRNWIIYPTIF
jgi:hypothetical protein